VQAAIDRLRPRAKEDNVTITVDLPIPSAMAYGPWLEEVIANLIENAIKYKNKSIASPTIAIRGFLTDDGLVRFEVSDNGVGIEPEFLKDLFKAGFRAKPGRVKGTGLGLALVERIVLRMNGKVGVESERGKGSTFWFTLPSAAD
jgi:signal transduction histidine kinase